MNLRQLWQRGRDLLPAPGFHFDRPLVLFQSDDWGRVGVRDKEGFDQLRSAGIALGEHPYDFYSLETADDLQALRATLKRHRDSTGRHPCLEMNFVVANLDFSRMGTCAGGELHFLPLAEGLPQGWSRPNLVAGYRDGIAESVFRAALHGTSHFCRSAVERNCAASGDRAKLLHTFWQSGTAYIHWRMPWIGYEYWDPEQPAEQQFVRAEAQCELIGQTVGAFAKLFSTLPQSACAPGYRANQDTHRAWGQHGLRVAQNGPGAIIPPHFDRHGLLHLARSVEFEPALEPRLSLEDCVQRAERSFERNLPAIVSVHSINFHSTVRDFRSRTLTLLDQFLTTVEDRHPDLLYLHDEDLHDLVTRGEYETQQGRVQVNVTRRIFRKASPEPRQDT